MWEILEVIHATKENLQVNTEIIIFWENQNCRTGTIEMAFQGCKIDKDNKTEDPAIISKPRFSQFNRMYILYHACKV